MNESGAGTSIGTAAALSFGFADRMSAREWEANVEAISASEADGCEITAALTPTVMFAMASRAADDGVSVEGMIRWRYSLFLEEAPNQRTTCHDGVTECTS
jgi:hypothetical protein